MVQNSIYRTEYNYVPVEKVTCNYENCSMIGNYIVKEANAKYCFNHYKELRGWHKIRKVKQIVKLGLKKA